MPVSRIRKDKFRTATRRPRNIRMWLAVGSLGTASLLLGGVAHAQQVVRPTANALPVGKVPGVNTNVMQPQVLGGRFGVTNAGGAVIDPNAYVTSGATGTIRQLDSAGILQWSSFDIGSGARVQVVQPSASAVLLNRVDGALTKTVIDGMLSSNGQVYIANPNGIIFGKGAQVDVNSLLATSLNIDNSRFLKGLLTPSTSAFFNADASLGSAGAISVEGEAGQQARISAANGGRIMLAAPVVTNSGILSAPDGQVVLAGGGRVFLASPTDLRMRGLLVEVGNDNLADGRSSVTNDVLGRILVGRGNATLAGLAVNQSGTVSATTAVTANGSIYLQAREGVNKSDPNALPVATNRGALVLGTGSVTEVRPDLSDPATTSSTTTFNTSLIDMTAKSVLLQSGATVTAPGGDVKITTRGNPANSVVDPGGTGRIFMERDASIDVSGTTSTRLAMEKNVIEVQLRGPELADSPLQRGTVVSGETLSIDIRKGTPLGNVSGYLALVEQNIGQRSAVGGAVTFVSDGDAIVAAGAKVDVSGGRVTYASGHVATSQLTSAGRVYDIANATPDRVYDGIVKAEAGPRNFEAEYFDGRSAGSVAFNAPNLILRGEFKGTATPGARQRDVRASGYPGGGTFIVGSDQRVTSERLANYLDYGYRGVINVGGKATADLATPAFGDVLEGLYQPFTAIVDVPVAAIASGGFNRVNAYTQGEIAVRSGVALGAGGELRLAAQNGIHFDAGVATAGGSVEVVSATGQVSVADGARFDVAGRFANDRLVDAPRDAHGYLTTAIVRAGGSISLAGQTVSVGNNVSFDASGGATLGASGAAVGGSAGSITLLSKRVDDSDPLSAQLSLGSGVGFSAYGLVQGGTLKLTGRNVVLGGAAADARDLGLASGFFQQGGFAKYDIGAEGNLTVLADAGIAPRMSTWSSAPRTVSTAAGLMASAFDIATLPLASVLGSRGASSLSLAARSEVANGAGRLWLQPGASITADPGASVTLTAGRQLTLDKGSSVTARGGEVGLYLTPALGGVAGYRDERSIWLGTDSLVDARGTDAERVFTNRSGVSGGGVLDGGRIQIGRIDTNTGNLAPASGYVITEAGSRLDVSGGSASMTLGGRGGVVTTAVASAGGSIDIRATEGMLLEGALRGSGGSSAVAGGRLSLVLDRAALAAPAGFPAGERTLTVARVMPGAGTSLAGIVPRASVVQNGQTVIVNAFDADQSITGQSGNGYVLADTINHGGFDRVNLKAQDAVKFDVAGASAGLTARASIAVDAPVLKVSGTQADSRVDLNAANVQLGNTDWKYQVAGAAAVPGGGGAELAVTARTIDLVGSSVLQGVGKTTLSATGDIRLVGQASVDVSAAPPVAALPVIRTTGAFAVTGALALESAQVYPTSLSEFTLSATGVDTKGENNSIIFTRMASEAAPPAAPLAAAGSLTVKAHDIAQNGVVRAPLGSISLTAEDKLGFGAGSLTSVAGSGVVPLGRVSNGRDWVYDFGNGNTITLNDTTQTNGVNLAAKSITSSAGQIVLGEKAVIDASGGGNHYAYEFAPGPGGSRDVLAKAAGASAVTTFAVLPGFSGEVAPRDYQYGADGGLRIGDSVYLSGFPGAGGKPGLAAGFYTLLPAHYALLPNAFAVTAKAGTQDMVAAGNYAQADGTWVVAGKLGAVNAGNLGAANTLNSRSTGFVVASGDQVRKQSEFVEYTGDSFFAGRATARAQDGGRVAFSVTNPTTGPAVPPVDASVGLSIESLVARPRMLADGSLEQVRSVVRLGGSGGGAAGSADISATSLDIAVVGSAAQGVNPGAIKVSSGALAAMGADSLLIGGLRVAGTDGDHLTSMASTVRLDNTAASSLSGPEVILAARDTVSVTGTSSIGSAGIPARPQRDLIVDGTGTGADGALLRVSGGSAIGVVRNNPAQVKGTLDIAAGATVTATGSMNLDATANLINGATLGLGTGTALSLGANRVSLGDAIPLDTSGLVFNRAGLERLNALSALSLTSYGTLDIYGNANLGGAAMQNLSIASLGIVDRSGGPNDVVFSATGILSLSGFGASTPVAPGTVSTRAFRAGARDILIGDGNVAVQGFANADLDAGRELRATGKDGGVAAQGNMTLTAGRIGVANGAAASFSAGGALKLVQAAGAEPVAPGVSLGGSLAFSGNTVESAATVVANAGRIALSGVAGVSVKSGRLDVSGQPIAFGSTYGYAPGGTLTLDAGMAGNVSIDRAAMLDVSAIGADAGHLGIKASGGRVELVGAAVAGAGFKGAATAASGGTAPAQGSASIDVANFSAANGNAVTTGAINQSLNAGGFGGAREIRVRSGDLALAAGESIVARDVLLSADNGNVSLGGTIDASGLKGGSIQVFAGQATGSAGKGNILIANTARLLANSTASAATDAGSAGDGGRVLLGTSTRDLSTGALPGAASGNAAISIDAPNGALQAEINVSGSGGQGGTVSFRAPRINTGGASAGNDVAITGLANAKVTGSRETTIEAYKVYTGSQITAANGTATNLDARTSGTANTSNTANNTQAFVSGPVTFAAGASGVATATEIITFPSAHGFSNNEKITYSRGGGTLIGGLVDGGTYYVQVVDGQKLKLSITPGGTAVNLTTAGAGSNHSITSSTAGSSMYAEAASFMGNQSAILGRLDAAGANGVQLRVGMEVQSASDLLVNVNETNNNPYIASASARTFRLRDRGWNLNAWRFGSDNQPGVLTLRAADDLTIRGSISDGFSKPATDNVSMPDWRLDQAGGASWSFRLAGGADLSAANPLAVIPRDDAAIGKGNVTLAFQPASTATATARSFSATDQPVALLRTGSGSIDIAAGNNFTMERITGSAAATFGATVYTAGVRSTLANTVSGTVAPRAAALNTAYGATGTVTTGAEFAERGGDVSIAANNNITGPATDQLVNNWLFRRGRTNASVDGTATVFALSGSTPANAEAQQTAWWVRYDHFNQGVATFGGGDVNVTAGRGTITDLSVSAATNGQVSSSVATSLEGAALTERGGGDVRLVAGGDIRGGNVYVQKGEAVIRAGGSIGASGRTVTVDSVPGVALRPAIALGDATASVVAGGDLGIESVFNPTQTRQSSVNAAAATGAISVNASSGVSSNAFLNYGYFSTYGQGSAVSLTAINGDVTLGNNARALLAGSGAQVSTPARQDNADFSATNMFRLYPGTLNVAALQGDISIERGFTLAPNARGQLNLLAQGSVRSSFADGSGERVVMSDLDPTTLPGVLSPRALSVKGDIDLLTYAKFTDGLQFHTNGGLHAGDPEPVRIVALAGDVAGDQKAVQTFILPKRAEILAGNDIRNLGFKIQHVDAADVTRIEAGRDIIDSTGATGPINVSHQISGPGRVDMQSGRNVDLGNGQGLTTRGSLDNPYLPDKGAGINLTAGARADYAAFVRASVGIDDLSPADQAALVEYMRSLQPALPVNLGAAEALAAFKALPASQSEAFLQARKPLFNNLFFTKVRLASQGPDGAAAADLTAFDGLIASMFPGGTLSGGDINVFGSQIKTERGGEINMFAPGGSVYAGLLQQPAWLAAQLRTDPSYASRLGVTTIRGGEIQALVKKDFLVNQGRVFSLGGGDITLVSQFGDIDAGRGAKTAVSAPPPVIRVDPQTGNVVVDVSGSISGSGIATLRAGDDVPASNVYPVAPRGTFNAGDAGVRSSGSVVIVADKVLNAGNITAGSGVSGAKTADTSGLGGAVAAAPAAPATRAESFAAAPPPNPDAAATLTVELLGLGAGPAGQGGAGPAQATPGAPADKPDPAQRRRSPGDNGDQQ